MLDYPSLAAVAAVAREGSFEKAAIGLGVTPSAVSQRIKGLEDRLGAILLIRGSPCRPTEIGGRLCAHIEQVRLLESEVIETLPGLTLQVVGPASIRVAVNADSVSTWFPKAAALFAGETGGLLDLVLDDEAHTAQRLQTGDVLAAVTADPSPVVGCRIHPLGQIEYMAVVEPAFAARHFPGGVDNLSLQRVPMLRFDRRDDLQFRWAREACGTTISPPTHWTPSTQGMLDMTLAGLGWSMAPVALAEPLIAEGRLIELPPHKRIAVTLYWQRTRLAARLLDQLTQAVRAVAAKDLQSASHLGRPGSG
ncbi:LysR family transcriptional regulator ArgP [Bosea lathyri]|uniref:LysR family transcriptional regulator, chromosome initiation inhibitor n=1 Tax=Bosea lathyri TaxID=1036778 RepID=A0A1H6CIY1_9HYPH|nr:LysR family transcriptional regulator ArgP [Bosea lathyri]SEG72675.1 LysR family transcriptional regulator, chromosome initiation inhibitor [Bosea lathyri]